MRRETIVDGVTAGVTTDAFNVYHTQPATLCQRGVAGSEIGQLQILVNGTFTDVYDDSDSLVQFTVTANIIFIEIPGRYQIVLDATAAATSIDKYQSGV